METFIKYIRDTSAEMKQVRWPTQRQAAFYTVLVIAISVLVSLFTSAFDFVFLRAIEAFVSLF